MQLCQYFIELLSFNVNICAIIHHYEILTLKERGKFTNETMLDELEYLFLSVLVSLDGRLYDINICAKDYK